jgi:hypothetical protein
MDTLSSCLTAGELYENLEDLSRNVDSAYSHIMARIKQQDDSRCELAMRALCWVAFGYHLTITELQHALAVAPGRTVSEKYLISEDILMEVCAGLIHIVQDGDSSISSGRRTSGKATITHFLLVSNL